MAGLHEVNCMTERSSIRSFALFCWARFCPTATQGLFEEVQAVNDLPKAQASLRDEFAGVARGSGQ